MKKSNKIIFLIFVLILFLIGVISNGCANNDEKKRKEYEKCTSVCASVLEEDFVTMELCRQKCKEEFLDGK